MPKHNGTKGTKYAYLGDVTGSGPTLKAARDDLRANVERFVNEACHPVVLAYRGHLAIVYRLPYGWCYRVTTADRLANEDGDATPSVITAGGHSLTETIQEAGYHIVQNGMEIDSVHSEDDLPEWLGRKKREDLVSWARWQRAARHAKSAHPEWDHNLIHAWACQYSGDEQFA